MLTIKSHRLRASLIHFAISTLFALALSGLVLGLWYPWPFWKLSGGLFLFGLVVGIDVILGPVLTLLVFNPNKSRTHLLLDMSVVVGLQLGALSYGVWSVWQARPVQLVFEYDRFGVARASEVDLNLFSEAQSGINPLPWNGPGRVALRPFHSEAERMEATLLAITGAPLAIRVDLWQPYENAREKILKTAKPLTELLESHPQHADALLRAVEQAGVPQSRLVFLPLVSGRTVWTVLLDAQSAEPLAFAPVDPF